MMKKIKMNPLYRIGGIILSVIILILSICFIYIQVTNVPMMIVEDVLFEGTVVPRATYSVFLKDNEYFDNNELGSGGIYVRNLVEKVRVNLGATYTGSKQAELKGEYQIYARVKGYQGSEEGKDVIWSKDFIFDKRPINAADTSIEFDKGLEIDISDYDDLIGEVSRDFGVSLSYDLTIHLEGEVQVDSEVGSISLPITASVLVPLKSNLFNIQVNNSNIATDTIVKSKRVVDKDAINYIPIGILGIILSISACAFIIFFTRKPTEEETRKERWVRCLRNYKSRMVKLMYISKFDFLHQNRIEHLQDLVKLSDEMRTPIFYIGDEEQVIADGSLFVIHDNDIFLHVLK